MTFIGKQMPRRTFLRGMGATVALPMLDAMVPARGLVRLGAAVDPTRLICIEAVHGAAGLNKFDGPTNDAPAAYTSGVNANPANAAYPP